MFNRVKKEMRRTMGDENGVRCTNVLFGLRARATYYAQENKLGEWA